MSTQTPHYEHWFDVDASDAPSRITVRISAIAQSHMAELVDEGAFLSESEIVRCGVRRVIREPGDHADLDATRRQGVRRSVRLTEELANAAAGLVEADHFPTTSDVVRDGIHRILDDYDDLITEADR